MRGKLLFVAGAAVGVVLGARAGRERYDQIKETATRVWQSPTVQKQVHAVEDFVADKAGEFPDTVYITVKRLIVRANQRRREARAPYPPSPAAEAAIRRAEGRSDTSA
jgi:oxygen-dependent protoporphyrinogen oxidase